MIDVYFVTSHPEKDSLLSNVGLDGYTPLRPWGAGRPVETTEFCSQSTSWPQGSSASLNFLFWSFRGDISKVSLQSLMQKFGSHLKNIFKHFIRNFAHSFPLSNSIKKSQPQESGDWPNHSQLRVRAGIWTQTFWFRPVFSMLYK